MTKLPPAYANAVTFTFGDTPALCADLLARVRRGQKTATCEALRNFSPHGDAMPTIGRRDVALNWDGTPALVIETTEVTIRRFCDVDANFALSEGEDDTLQGWQAAHRAYFTRNGGWTADMDLVCERFVMIHDFASSQL